MRSWRSPRTPLSGNATKSTWLGSSEQVQSRQGSGDARCPHSVGGIGRIAVELPTATRGGRLGRRGRRGRSRERTQPQTWLAVVVGVHPQEWDQALVDYRRRPF